MTREQGLIGAGWRSALRDVALVVLSILIAFGLDAWWDSERDRRAEHLALSGLRTDFEANRSLLDEALAAHGRTLAATHTLLDAAGPGATFEDSLQPALDGLLGTHTFDPLEGTLTDLLSSGRLGLIRDDSLRTMLAAWPSWIRDAAEDEIDAKRQTEEHVVPLLGRHVPLRDTAVGAGLLDGLARSGFEGTPDTLLRSVEFESMLTSRAVLTDIVLQQQVALRARIDQILQRLDRVLER